MTKNYIWLFQDSPILLLVLDDALICRGLTSVWREQLALPDSGNAAGDGGIPAADLFDFENKPAVLDQISALINEDKA